MRNKDLLWGGILFVVVILWLAFMANADAAETDRQYTERVHTYAHGNSLGIQALRRTTDAIEKVNVKQDKAIAGKVDTATFKKDQARQDKALDGVAKETSTLKARANQNDLLTSSHTNRLDGHDSQFASISTVNSALNTRLAGAYERLDEHSARLDSLERKADRADEANAVALAVAGHQFDTKGGFQTAISASTMNGKQALAVGMGGALSDRVFVNAGVAASGSTTGGVISSTYSW